MLSLAEQVIIDILTKEMSLKDGNIWIRDQNKKIPGDLQLYMVVGMVDARVMSSETYMIEREIPRPPLPTIVQQIEVNRVNMAENIQVDLFSRSNEAVMRRWEVIAALRSIYSTQKQEANFFKIYRIPSSFVNSSSAEGGSQLNRFSIIVPCNTWHIKEKVLTPDGGDYYDDFSTRVDDEKTIGTDKGIIEFNISEEE